MKLKWAIALQVQLYGILENVGGYKFLSHFGCIIYFQIINRNTFFSKMFSRLKGVQFIILFIDKLINHSKQLLLSNKILNFVDKYFNRIYLQLRLFNPHVTNLLLFNGIFCLDSSVVFFLIYFTLFHLTPFQFSNIVKMYLFKTRTFFKSKKSILMENLSTQNELSYVYESSSTILLISILNK